MRAHTFVAVALAAAVALSACATLEETVSAGSNTQPLAETSAPSDPRPCGFSDADGDGVCDHAKEGCNKRGRGHGPNFVDADGDGVCDRAAEGCAGCGRGRGHGPNFIDQDGDGVCDHRGRRGAGD